MYHRHHLGKIMKELKARHEDTFIGTNLGCDGILKS